MSPWTAKLNMKQASIAPTLNVTVAVMFPGTTADERNVNGKGHTELPCKLIERLCCVKLLRKP